MQEMDARPWNPLDRSRHHNQHRPIQKLRREWDLAHDRGRGHNPTYLGSLGWHQQRVRVERYVRAQNSTECIL